MKFKIALAALLGVMVGAIGGAYVGYAAASQFVGLMFMDHAESRYTNATLLLKLLDDNNIAAAKQMLLGTVQSETILIASLHSSSDADVDQRMLRYARLSGDLKSVREDDSELGKTAAEARKNLPVLQPNRSTPKP